MDTIGVRYGCTFTGFTSTGFSGNKMVVTADTTDRYRTREATIEYIKIVDGLCLRMMKNTNSLQKIWRRFSVSVENRENIFVKYNILSFSI